MFVSGRALKCLCFQPSSVSKGWLSGCLTIDSSRDVVRHDLRHEHCIECSCVAGMGCLACCVPTCAVSCCSLFELSFLNNEQVVSEDLSMMSKSVITLTKVALPPPFFSNRHNHHRSLDSNLSPGTSTRLKHLRPSQNERNAHNSHELRRKRV